MSDSDVYEVTCPSCGKTYQLRRVNARARTCPACGHVWARDPAAERKLGGDGGSGAGGNAGEQPPAPSSAAAAVADPPKVKKLGGAAAIAHAQKARGERVTIGNVRAGKRAAAAAVAAADPAGTLVIDPKEQPRPRFLDRLKRIL